MSILDSRPALKAAVWQVAETAGYLWTKGWAERNGGNITVNVTEYVDDGMHSASFGFGYSSPGSFFLDLAVKFTKYQDSIYYPYFDYPNCNSDGVRVDVPSPEIRNSRNQTSAVATFGWRF